MKNLILQCSKSLIMLLFQMIATQMLGQEERQHNLPAESKVYGTIIDASNNQPVPYASVAIYRAKDSTLITGVMSKDDGSFVIEGLPYGKFYIQVTFIGYKKQNLGGITLSPNQTTDALGTLKINPSTTSLAEVEVVASNPPIKYQIDKKVVDISKNITASGGTVADALQNVPSVQTDVQGNVTLRGSSNFTVLVDGRPSPIEGSEALQQIPANLVQSVEIITNPSAKYEAEGSAGIINVVMKKQKIQGTSGMLNATAGTGDKYSSNLNLNYKVSKFSFTLGADFTDMKSSVKSDLNNTDTLGTQKIKTQTVNGSGSFQRQGKGINAGIDYAINDKNSLTLTGSWGSRSFSRPITSDYHDEYLNLLNSNATDINYTNSSTPEFKRNYYSLNLDYLLKLNNNGHQLSASAYLMSGPDNNFSSLVQDTTNASWISLGKNKIIQQSAQNSNETQLRTKLNYSLPVGTKGKFEAGYQGTYKNSSADSYVNNYIDNSWIEDAAHRDKLSFDDQIQAGYATFSDKMSLFDYEIGLRTEYEDRSLNQEIQNEQYRVNRIDFFPSVYLTKQLPWNLQIQADYSRRVDRPRENNIDPFVVYLDPLTIRKGNPGLLPQFTNSYELNLHKAFNNASFISLEGFLRQTSNLIQQISTFDPATQITTSTFANIDHDRSIGAELMMYIEPTKWFNLNSSFNIYNYHMFGTPIPSVSDNINTWNIRVNPTFHVARKTTVQLSYAYNAPTITAQGTRSGFYFSTLGIKQILFKQQGSLTLQVRDLFGQTNFVSTTESANQYKYNSFQRESKVILLTFSYRINNYKTKNRQSQDDLNNGSEGEDMEQGL
ncbi:MAG TPA: outer membrane beta-barrel family protein [Bacteroidales bacterium]